MTEGFDLGNLEWGMRNEVKGNGESGGLKAENSKLDANK
jgi:hypothetical protein